VRDLNFPLKIIVAPTVRERGGLAMSSRNKYLSADERKQALVLSQALRQARALARKSPTARQLKKQLLALIEKQPAAKLDYLEFFDSETLEPVAEVKSGVQMALAVFIGKTRL